MSATPEECGAGDLRLRRAGPEDAAALSRFADECFRDTFAADNDPADMEHYAAEAFSPAVQARELEDARHIVVLAERGGSMAGYAMLREGDVPACAGAPAEDAIEIARLYAGARWIGTGVGRALMHHCLEVARQRGRRCVWLGVWERNARAIAFYRRFGFVDCGSQAFQLGRDRQTDRVMIRRLPEADDGLDERGAD